MHPKTRAAHRRLVAGWKKADSFVQYNSRALNPVDFGADPTCQQDSSAAFTAITAALMNMTTGSMSDSNLDLGAATIDLQGGCYLLSQTWYFPQNHSNFHVAFGELRAHPSFKPNATLVQVGATPCNFGQGSCNQNAGFHGVTFDGQHIAGTLLEIVATMGAVVDSSSVFLNFVLNGIVLQGGHETMISDTWIAAYPWSSPQRRTTQSTGILINGNDHYVTNTIVYSAKVGVWITGAADILNGVHTWNQNTGDGGIGILNQMSQNRFEGCYLDYNDMVLRGAGAQQTVVSGGFFLGGAQLIFETVAPNQLEVYGTSIMGNEWYATGSAPLAVNESAGSWQEIHDITITGSTLVPGQPYVGTTATQIASNLPASANDTWFFDFSSQLLFPTRPILYATATLSGVPVGGDSVVPNVLVNYSTQAGSPLTVTVYAPGTSGRNYTMRVTVDQSGHSDTAYVQATGVSSGYRY